MSLTVVLPLKDRERFTERCIRAIGGSAQIVAADGSHEPQHRIFHDRPEIDYFYSGFDATLEHYWAKMQSAMLRIRTPYAMVMDNDDMVVADGVARCIGFLDHHPDYIACSGRIRGFWAWPDEVAGPHFARNRQYAPYDVPADYSQPTADERVLAGFQNSWSYYAVYRADTLRTIWNDVAKLNFSDLQVHEKFCAMRALTLGKIKCDGSFTSLQRQYGSSLTVQSQYSFAANLLHNQFCRDRDRVLAKMEECGVDPITLRPQWSYWYDTFLRRQYGWKATLRRAAKRRFPKLAWAVQNRHRWIPAWS